MGADVAGHVADRTAAAAADQAATYPRTLAWSAQGAQGTAATILPGHAGTRGGIRSAPRTLGKGNNGSVGIAG